MDVHFSGRRVICSKCIEFRHHTCMKERVSIGFAKLNDSFQARVGKFLKNEMTTVNCRACASCHSHRHALLLLYDVDLDLYIDWKNDLQAPAWTATSWSTYLCCVSVGIYTWNSVPFTATRKYKNVHSCVAATSDVTSYFWRMRSKVSNEWVKPRATL